LGTKIGHNRLLSELWCWFGNYGTSNGEESGDDGGERDHDELITAMEFCKVVDVEARV